MAVQTLQFFDEGMFDESTYGWYGQIGVLIIYTNVGILFFCGIQVIIIRVKEYTSGKKGEMIETNADRVEMNEERYWTQFELGPID